MEKNEILRELRTIRHAIADIADIIITILVKNRIDVDQDVLSRLSLFSEVETTMMIGEGNIYDDMNV